MTMGQIDSIHFFAYL